MKRKITSALLTGLLVVSSSTCVFADPVAKPNRTTSGTVSSTGVFAYDHDKDGTAEILLDAGDFEKAFNILNTALNGYTISYNETNHSIEIKAENGYIQSSAEIPVYTDTKYHIEKKDHEIIFGEWDESANSGAGDYAAGGFKKTITLDGSDITVSDIKDSDNNNFFKGGSATSGVATYSLQEFIGILKGKIEAISAKVKSLTASDVSYDNNKIKEIKDDAKSVKDALDVIVDNGTIAEYNSITNTVTFSPYVEPTSIVTP